MNKDEIQHILEYATDMSCCGLVMNKDEIQLHLQDQQSWMVVVW